MNKLQKQLKIAQPGFLKQLASSKIANKSKRFKITMAASMAV
jgi:hypothetical protein